MYVTIDIDAAHEVVRRLRQAAVDLADEKARVAGAGRAALCSTSALSQLSSYMGDLEQMAQELLARVDLAVIADIGPDGTFPTTGIASYVTSGDDGIESVKAAIGVTLADWLLAFDVDRDRFQAGEAVTRADVQRLDRLTALVETYARDSDVTVSLFAQLGGQGAARVPAVLQRLRLDHAAYLGSRSDSDERWDDDTLTGDHLGVLQARFQVAYGTALATTTRSSVFTRGNPPDGQPGAGPLAGFTGDLVAAVTAGYEGEGWALSQTLRHGAYDEHFLTDLATRLYAWEREEGSGGTVWAQNEYASWRLPGDTDERYADPFTGLFQAMERTPAAAVDFFHPTGGSPDGAEVQARVEYFLRARGTWAGDLEPVTEALAAAAERYHHTGASPQDQARSAWIASATVHVFGEDGQVSDGAAAGLTSILAEYFVDVDRTIRLDERGIVGLNPSSSYNAWEATLPQGAALDYREVRKVLNVLLGEPKHTEHTARLGSAMSELNVLRLTHAAEHSTLGDGSDLLKTAVAQSAHLNGYMLAVAGMQAGAAAKDQDANAKVMIDAVAGVPGLLEMTPLLGWAAAPVIEAGKSAATDAWGNSYEEVQERELNAREAANRSLQISIAMLLAEHDLYPADPDGDGPLGTFTDADGNPPSWYQRGVINPNVLEDEDGALRRDFEVWRDTARPGEAAKDLFRLAEQQFDEGEDYVMERSS